MAAPVASDILDEARNVYLNDPLEKLYTDQVLLPLLKKSYRDLQQQLIDNGVSVSREKSSAYINQSKTVSPVSG